MGYTHPTPVQRAVFEPAVRGQDLMVQARTGTGKTAAFGLPIVEPARAPQPWPTCRRSSCARRASSRCRSRASSSSSASPRNIKLDRHLRRRADGQADRRARGGRADRRRHAGPRARPPRRGTLDACRDPHARARRGRRDALDGLRAELIERSSSASPRSRQTLLLLGDDPARHRAHRARATCASPSSSRCRATTSARSQIQHYVYIVARRQARSALIRILEVEDRRARSSSATRRTRPSASPKRSNARATTPTGSTAISRRASASASWRATREGKLRFLVATDVAARGIDISHLTHVINYDFPESAELYVHRTGRTGRAGRTGTAISLIGPKDVGNLYMLRLTYKIRPIERQLPSAGELKTRAEADSCRCSPTPSRRSRAHPDDLALARRLLSHEGAEQIVAGLLRDHSGARPEAVEQAAAARRSKVAAPWPLRRTCAEERQGRQRGARQERAPVRNSRGRPRTIVGGRCVICPGGRRRDSAFGRRAEESTADAPRDDRSRAAPSACQARARRSAQRRRGRSRCACTLGRRAAICRETTRLSPRFS